MRLLPGPQPSLEKASLTKKQTLTYIKGYAHEASMAVVGEPRSSPSPDMIASHAFGSPQSQAQPSHLPKWVVNDRKVGNDRVGEMLKQPACSTGAQSRLRVPDQPWRAAPRPCTRAAGGDAGIVHNIPHVCCTSSQVLRFFGYYQEAVPESPIENHRIRKVAGVWRVAFFLGGGRYMLKQRAAGSPTLSVSTNGASE